MNSIQGSVKVTFGHLILYTVLVVGLTVWSASFLGARSDWLKSQNRSNPLEQAGQFGDSFGMANSLFTMVAMLGAAFAAYLQYTALHEQRESQAKLISEQQETTKAQAAASLASNVAAWVNLASRVEFDGRVHVTRLRLALEELRQRTILEIYIEAMSNGKTPSDELLRNSDKFKDTQLRISRADKLLTLYSKITSEDFESVSIETMETCVNSWVSAIKKIGEYPTLTDHLVYVEDFNGTMQEIANIYASNVKVAAIRELGMYKAGQAN